MKNLKLITVVIVWVIAGVAQAQVSVNVNIGTPPPWGPAGYAEVRYYYLPDVEAYYDINTSMFIYLGSGGVWVHRAYLPTRYRNYDLYGGYKVVMTDYRGDTPYSTFKDYRGRYARGYRGEAQRTIGQRPARGNSNAKAPHGGNNGRGKGQADSMGQVNGNGVIKSDGHSNENIKSGNKGHGEGNGKGGKK